MLAEQRTIAAQYGADPELWTAGIRRGLVRRNGAMFLRPCPEITQALRDGVQSDSLPQVPPELEPLMVAFRAGLRRDLDALVAARSNVEVREIDASHAVLFEKPCEMTEIISTFIARATRHGP